MRSRIIYALLQTAVFSLGMFLISTGAIAQPNTGIDPTFIPSALTDPNMFNGFARYQADGKIVTIIRYFDENAINTSAIFRANADGSIDNTFNCTACTFYMTSLAIQPDGKVLVAGFQNGPKVIRVNSDGSLDDSFVSAAIPGVGEATVYTTTADGKIYLSGHSVGGSGPGAFDVRTLYRMNANGSMDNTFTPVVFDRNAQLAELNQIMVLPDGKLMLAGKHPWGTLFRVNANGTQDTSYFSPVLTCGVCIPQIPAAIHSFYQQTDGKFVFAGNFTTVNGIARSFVARLNNDGGVDAGYAPSLPLHSGSEVGLKQMAVQADGKVIISAPFIDGNFNTLKFLRMNADGTVDNTFVPPTNSQTQTFWVLTPGEKILFFGRYSGGNDSFYRMNNDGSADNTFSFGVRTPSSVSAVAVTPDGKIIVAGAFKYLNAAARANIARLNADGSVDTTFAPGTGFHGGTISQILVQADGKLLVRGNFSIYNGATVSSPIRINTDGSRDASFAPTVNSVNTIALQADGKILLGGGNISVNGFSRTGVARLNSDGSLDAAFAPNIGTPSIRSLAVQPDGKILLGGGFSGLSGFNRQNFARMNPDGSCDTTFDAGNIGTMFHLTIQPDGKIIAIRNNVFLTRVNANGSTDTSFTEFSFAGGSVASIVLDGSGKIFVSGLFTTPNEYIARFNQSGNFEAPVLRNGADARVTSLARQADGKIVAGGYFKRFGNAPRAGLARLDSAIPSRVPFDFDGDGRTDLGVFRGTFGRWFLMRSSAGEQIQDFGLNGDKVVAADYNGDGKADIAIYRNGAWWYVHTGSASVNLVNWGTATDIPLPSDIDGDGKDDFVYYRPSTGEWVRKGSLGTNSTIQFGQAGDIPVIGDFDGDGKSDPTIFRPSTGTWWYKSTATGIDTPVYWGLNGDVPVAADYDADGKTDIAVWRPSNGAWYVINSGNGSVTINQWGLSADKPVPGDYDGDGRADLAIWRPDSGVWFILQSTAGFTGMQYGVSTDKAIPNAFLP